MDRNKIAVNGWVITCLAAHGANRTSHKQLWYSDKHWRRADHYLVNESHAPTGQWSNPNER